MRILIVEDEPLAAERLQGLLGGYSRPIEVAHWADSVRGAVQWLRHDSPDLMLLDIHLGDGLSFDIFEQTEVQAPAIFTTAFDQYAVRAFKVNSLDYLLKPVQKEELYQALDRFYEHQNQNTFTVNNELMQVLSGMVRQEYKSRFLVKLGEKLITVPVSAISYFFVEDRATLLRTRNGHTYPIGYTIEQLELMLNPEQFFRINRSYVVTVEAIESVMPFPGNRLEVIPESRHTKDPLVVSRELCATFRKWLGEG